MGFSWDCVFREPWRVNGTTYPRPQHSSLGAQRQRSRDASSICDTAGSPDGDFSIWELIANHCQSQVISNYYYHGHRRPREDENEPIIKRQTGIPRGKLTIADLGHQAHDARGRDELMSASVRALRDYDVGAEFRGLSRSRHGADLDDDARAPVCVRVGGGPQRPDDAPQGVGVLRVRREQPDGRGAMAREDGRRRRAEVRRRALRHQHEAHADGEGAVRLGLEELPRQRELLFKLCGCGRAGLEGPAALEEALDLLVGLHVVARGREGSGTVLNDGSEFSECLWMMRNKGHVGRETRWVYEA